MLEDVQDSAFEVETANLVEYIPDICHGRHGQVWWSMVTNVLIRGKGALAHCIGIVLFFCIIYTSWIFTNRTHDTSKICFLYESSLLFIGPESDHWQCLSVTH